MGVGTALPELGVDYCVDLEAGKSKEQSMRCSRTGILLFGPERTLRSQMRMTVAQSATFNKSEKKSPFARGDMAKD